MPEKDGEGVLVANGGSSAGYTLYIMDGKPVYEMNFFGVEHYRVESAETLPTGEVTLTMEYTQEGQPPEGGSAKLLVNGKEVANGKISKVPPSRYSATETLDIGMDLGAVVSRSYHEKAPYAFNGQIRKVAFELN